MNQHPVTMTNLLNLTHTTSRLLRLAVARPLTVCQFVAPLASNYGLDWLLDAIFRRMLFVTIALRRLSATATASCRAEIRFPRCCG
jgi:hypothetical protein